MLSIIIHRGTHQIGGNCVEIRDDNTRLLFDFGLPLDDRENIKLDINGLYKNDKPEIDGIFITHAHPDHYGLLDSVNSEIPVYTSKTTVNIIQNVSEIKGENNYSDLNLNIIENPVNIGDFTIIPHEVDHSAGGSLAFEIIHNGKKILYTGDLRFHGRISYLSRNLAKIKNVDYLIMEGSTLGRPDQKIKTEDDVFDEITNAFTTDKLCFVNFSSQNLDRFISVYKACLRTKKSLVIDPYTCFVLENFKEISKNIPQWNWNNIRVYFGGGKHTKNLADSGKLFTYKNKKISAEEILSDPEKYVVKTAKAICVKILSLYDISKIEYIYSIWSGYLDNPSYLNILKPQIKHIHTSGHAYVKDLQEFVQRIKPKVIIPIHTEMPQKYSQLYDAEIKILKDGEILNL